MRAKIKTLTTFFFLGAGFAVMTTANAAPNGNANVPSFVVYSKAVCPGPVSVGNARCNSWVVTDAKGTPKATGIVENSQAAKGSHGGKGSGGGGGGSSAPPPPPSGAYGPLQFQTAYGLSNILSGGATVAIVDAYDDPNITQDLASYIAAYQAAYQSTYQSTPFCTSGCFEKVDQTGGTHYPKPNQGWALEISLDVETVRAACPDCNILLVEAKSSSFTNLLAAEKYAEQQAEVVVVSNSWGGSEFSSETSYDNEFNTMLPITFSSGDSGYGVEWPAASPNVTAVGGTTLYLNTNDTRQSERAWSGSGSGCSAYEAQPTWQYSLGLSGCNNRMIADVSADADPATGAAVYDSYGYQGQSGWFTVGGTSLASPLIASTYALAESNDPGDDPSSVDEIYNSSSLLYDVTSGSSGTCGTFLCDAGTGYDGPTGLGTPDGAGAF